MSELFPARNCPTCGAAPAAGAPAVRASAPPAETLPFDELRDSWRGFFRDRKPFFTYVRCGACGQLFCPRYFCEAQLGELYRQMDDNTGGQDEALLRRTQTGYWRLLRRQARFPQGDYLELGPDIGLFTAAAATEPALKKFWLLEPNLAVHGALARAAEKKAPTLLADPAQLEEIPDRSLALVVAIHVLDHLLEPQRLLGLLARKLRAGGVALAVTHSERSLAARVFGVRWPAWCLQHPQVYAPATLRAALERAGLGGVRVRRTTNHFPVRYLIRHGLFAVGWGGRAIPLPEGWTIGLKLGNIAAVARRAT